ncbi:MAG: SdrD B-like domain-containing protein [Actinomycetota bacterium]
MSPALLARSHGGHVRRVLILTLATLLLFTVMTMIPGSPAAEEAEAAEVPWIENRLKMHEVWEPAPAVLGWVPGHPKGYTEGETAAFRITMEAAAGEQYRFNACLDFDDSGAYAFTKVEPWNTSHGAMTPPPAFGDLTGNVAPGFNGANLTIDNVAFIGEGGGLCPANYLGWEVTFTMLTTGLGYVVYGGHLAAPDETYSWGTVGDGQGASSVSGVFQARIDTQGGGDKTVNFSGKEIIPLVPDIQIQKATSDSESGPWHDADSPTGPYIAVGADVYWKYVVTNNGEADLTEVTVSDDQSVTVDCGGQTTLATGNSMTCTASGTAAAGQYENIGRVDAIYNEVAVSGTDLSHYFGSDPAIALEKSGTFLDESGDGYAQPGETISYSFKVTNTGNVTLTNVTIADKVGGVTISGGPIASLAPGASNSTTFTGSYVVTQGDIDAGTFFNVATACGIDPDEEKVCDDDAHREPLPQNPSIAIAKTPDAQTIYTGETATFTIAVTNNGNVTLTDVAVSDALVSACDAALGTLKPGEAAPAFECSGLDIQESFTNVAVASGTPPDGPKVTDDDDANVVVLDLAKLTVVVKMLAGTDREFHFFGEAGVADFSVTTLNRTGQKEFPDLKAGTYKVRKELASLAPDHLVLVDSYCDNEAHAISGDDGEKASVTLAEGDDVTCTFVLGKVLATAQIGDTVFLDKDKDGKQDAGEPGINGAKVVLKDADGKVIATLTTAKNAWDGFYKFFINEGIPGTFTVALDTKSVTGALTTAGSFTVDLAGGDDYVDADFGVAEVLPKTGTNIESLGLLALALLAAGAVAVLFTRRKREDL